ncbi:MAG: hypothetical protein QM689_12865 [Oscillospiraceae bacterium]
MYQIVKDEQTGGITCIGDLFQNSIAAELFDSFSEAGKKGSIKAGRLFNYLLNLVFRLAIDLAREDGTAALENEEVVEA